MSPRRRSRGRRGAPANGTAPEVGPAVAADPNATDGSDGADGSNERQALPTPARPTGSGPRRFSAPAGRSTGMRARPAPSAAGPQVEGEAPEEEPAQPGRRPGCTLAQMRRFIKSRPYVPVHELRRRFLIEGDDDEVNAVPTDKGLFYVGLPPAEAAHLAELIKAGEVGYELLLDPASPAVVGVFPMRPVARQ
jgi:hypothetical protein